MLAAIMSGLWRLYPHHKNARHPRGGSDAQNFGQSGGLSSQEKR